MGDGKDKLIPLEEAAERLGISRVTKDWRRTMRRMSRRGELQTRRVSKYLMVVEKSVDNIIAGRP